MRHLLLILCKAQKPQEGVTVRRCSSLSAGRLRSENVKFSQLTCVSLNMHGMKNHAQYVTQYDTVPPENTTYQLTSKFGLNWIVWDVSENRQKVYPSTPVVPMFGLISSVKNIVHDIAIYGVLHTVCKDGVSM